MNMTTDTLELNPGALSDLYEAARECLKAEHERQRKLKPNSPASTYTAQRIARIEAAISKAKSRR